MMRTSYDSYLSDMELTETTIPNAGGISIANERLKSSVQTLHRVANSLHQFDSSDKPSSV